MTLFDHSHATHRMHANSLEAWRGLDLGPMQLRVMEAYDVPRTDREVRAVVERALGRFLDMNAVRPRVTELVKAGVLEEVGKRKENGRAVRLVRRKDVCDGS